jgi:hypothetical protein
MNSKSISREVLRKIRCEIGIIFERNNGQQNSIEFKTDRKSTKLNQ